MNYIEMYEIMVPEMNLEIAQDQRSRFEKDMKFGKHPHQVKILEMINERIKELS